MDAFHGDAFSAYGHEQGDNARISEAAAVAYTSALNHFLERDNGHRIQVGDTSTVFWADASDALAAGQAESIFRVIIDERQAEAVQEKKVEGFLAKIRSGRPMEDFKPDRRQCVRFFVF